MKTINLMQWCDPLDTRPTMQRPYALCGRDYALNGYTLVSVPATGAHAEPEDVLTKGHLERLRGLIEAQREFVPLPPVTMPEETVCTTCRGGGFGRTVECPECGGDGSVYLSTRYHDYEPDCKSCDGEGRVFEPAQDAKCVSCSGSGKHCGHVPVAIAGMHVAADYLQLIIDLPDVMISAEPEKYQLHFRAGDARGIIMGMKV